jgi:hypothetical protein
MTKMIGTKKISLLQKKVKEKHYKKQHQSSPVLNPEVLRYPLDDVASKILLYTSVSICTVVGNTSGNCHKCDL